MKRNVISVLCALLLVALSFSLMPAKPARAAAYTASVTGNWTSTATWGGAGPPVAGDNITINTGVIVTVDTAAACGSIVINAPAANNGITISGANSLTVSGPITVNAPGTNSVSDTLAVGTGTLSAGSIAIAGGTASKVGQVTVSTGIINVTGSITFSGTAGNARLTFTGAGTLNIGGNLGTGGTFAASTGTVNYNAAGAQTVGVYTYNNLILSGSGAKTFAVTTVSGNLTLSGTATATTGANLAITQKLDVGTGTTLTTGATFTIGVTGTSNIAGTFTLAGTGAKTFTGDVTINSGAVWNETGVATYSIAGNFTNNATTFTANTGVHTFSGAGKMLSGATTTAIPSVTFSTGAGPINNGTLTAATALTVTGVTLTNNGVITATTALSGTGGLTNSAAGTLNIGGTCSITTLTNSGNATITGAGAISTALANFTNTGTLNLNGSGTITGITNNAAGTVNLTSSGTITSFNNATSTSTLDISDLTVPTITTLTVTAAGNTVKYSGAGAQTVKDVAYGGNLIISGSGTKTWTLGAARIITGNLTIGDGTTLSVAGAFAFTVTGLTTVGEGTSGTLSITNATGTKTFTGAVTINSGGAITETAAATLSFGSDVTITGTLTESGAATVGIAGNLVTNGTYAASTGVHTFSGTTQILSGSSPVSIGSVAVTGTYTNNGVLIVGTALSGAGGLTNSATGTLNIGGTCSVTTLANSGNSTITGSGAISTVLANFTNSGSLNLNGSGTIAGITNSGTITLNSSGTITALTNNSAGTLGISASTVPTITTLTATAAGNIVTYNGTAQTVKGTTYDTLNIAGSGTKALDAATVVNGDLTINSGATLSTNTTSNFALTFGGDFLNNGGTFSAGSSAITVANTAATQSIAGFTTTNAVSMTKTAGTATFTGNVSGAGLTINGSGGTLNLGTGLTHTFTGLWTRTAGTLDGGSSTLKIGSDASGTGGTFTANAGTVEWNANGAQNLAVVTYNNLTLSGTSAKTFPAGTTNITGILSLEGTATASLTGSIAYGAGATLEYKGSATQTTGAEFPSTFGGSGGVTIDNASNVTLGSSVAINYGLTLTSGTFSVGANILTLNGPTIAGTPTNLSTTSSSTLIFGGSSSGVNLPSSVTALNNLTLNNANGITLNSSPTISGSFILTSGIITTGSNTLNLAAGISISGGGAATYVNGNLRKEFNTGPGQSFTFHIGDASNYTPVGIAGMSVSTSGNLSANTTAGDHPNISTSGIDAAKSANRYWTLTASGGLVVSTYNGTFNFVGTDLDVSTNTSNFVVRKYAASTWSAPAGGSVAGSTNTTGIGFTSFGDFIAAEPMAAPTVTAVGLYQADRTTAVTAMTPQVEYAIKVSVTDIYNLSNLTTVYATLYYDAGGTYNPLNIPLSGNNQTAAIMTDTVGGSPSWSINPSANTTWSLVSGNSTQPSLAGTSGDFWFHFKPGKVATGGNVSGKWFIYARATSPYGYGDNHQDNRTMNWYGEISVNTASVNFGSAAPGSDFTSNNQTGISVTYISNSAYSMPIKLNSPWSGSGNNITLNTSGTPGTSEFSVKANSTAVLGSAVVGTTNYVTIATGNQTGESGVTVSTHTLWLKLGALGIPAVQYSGTIYYGIAP